MFSSRWLTAEGAMYLFVPANQQEYETSLALSLTLAPVVMMISFFRLYIRISRRGFWLDDLAIVIGLSAMCAQLAFVWTLMIGNGLFLSSMDC